ncbi:MAG TPA: hypothetical protein VLF15_09710, partial [Pseudoxanthomonas sp.]|nr:hypothetical protein [Pseudoxanthomonas sp.]
AASRPDAPFAVPPCRHPGVRRDPVTLLVTLTAGNSTKAQPLRPGLRRKRFSTAEWLVMTILILRITGKG